MTQPRTWRWVVLSCVLLFAARPLQALPPDSCAPLIDPDYDRANLAYANVKISDGRSACFLLPRSLVFQEMRESARPPAVALDPQDLLRYLNGKPSIRIEAEERRIDQAIVGCLADPVPDGILISGGPPLPLRPTVAALKSGLLAMDLPPEEAVGDMTGYRRYVSQGPKYREEYYFPDSEPDPRFAFWCGNFTDPETCSINGSYDGMSAAIRYRKDDMHRVRPDEALACVGRIGDLFRLR